MRVSSLSDRGKLKPQLIKIHILRNGDTTFKGSLMKLQPDTYKSLKDFLADVTNTLKRSVFIHIGGVRCLYHLNGTKINSLLDLKDNEIYVATCLSEQFKNVAYSQSQRPSSAAIVSRAESVYSATSSKTIEDAAQSESFRAKRITIVRDGTRPRKIFRVLLNSRNTHNMESVLTVINEAAQFDSAPLHVLYTLSGTPVTEVDHIYGYNFIFFAFRKECAYYTDDLELTEEEVHTVTQLNKLARSDNISLKVPPQKEPAKHMILPQIAVKYNLDKTIGTGSFSTIIKCSVKMRQDDGVRYALKIINKNRDNYKSIQQELQILKGLRHPNIVRLFSIHDSPSDVYLIFELLDQDLHTILYHDAIEEGECRVFMENILSALFYLHCLKIVHRGVRPSNLVLAIDISGNRILKLIDFGLACRTFKPLYEICGETFFLAPEMLRGEGYGVKVDVWAAGIVLYYMLTKTPPFLGNDEDEDKQLILQGEYDLVSSNWKMVSGGAKQIIGRMLCQCADERPSAEQALAHPWVTGDGFDESGVWEEDKSQTEEGEEYFSNAEDSDGQSLVDLYAPKRSKKVYSLGSKSSSTPDGMSDVDSGSEELWEEESVGDGFEYQANRQDLMPLKRRKERTRVGGEGDSP